MPYYVVRHGNPLNTSPEAKIYHNVQSAIEVADERRKETGFHYNVMRVGSVYTTQTLEESMKE